MYVITDHVLREDKAFGTVRLSIRLSVRPFVLTLLNRLTFELEFCVRVMTVACMG